MAQVMTDVWAARRARAAALTERYAFARQVLDLLAALLPVQEAAFRQARETPPAAGRIAAYVAERVLPDVVAATMEAGPPGLKAALEGADEPAAGQAVVAAWMFGDEQSPAERYLARASLSPVLEAMGETASAAFRGTTDARHCPRCGGPPQLAYFAVAEDDLASGGRRLVCARCHAEWGYPRMTCAGCGEQAGSRLPVYGESAGPGERGAIVRGLGPPSPAPGDLFPHMRIEACETCHRYLLNIDVALEPRAVPLVDEAAALPLDLYARDRGFTKITPNLMGF